jgi:hypothetical protein
MPTVAGTYEIRVSAYLGSPNDGLHLRARALDRPGGSGCAADATSSAAIHARRRPGRDVADALIRAVAGQVVIRVHDMEEAAVAGVLVTGRWGKSGSVSCTTGSAGACALTRDLRKGRASIVFTVLGPSKTSYTYASAENPDPDGDSNGTKITVTRP